MSSQDLQTLQDMGFERDRALRALEVTGHQGVEPAMEWLLAHADESLSDSQNATSFNTTESACALTVDRTESTVSGSESEETLESSRTEDSSKPSDEASGPAPDAPSTSACGTETVAEPLPDDAEEIGDQAKSLKCDECGKIFKSQLEIEYHAAKSNHSSFSESSEEKKPLSEEEKKEQLKKLEEKMRAKRLEREEKEKKDAFEREKNRIRSGKEMIAARKKLEEQEMKKLVEQHKREKLEEKLARQRVKEQIEQDKIARKAKFGMGSSSMFETPIDSEFKREQEIPQCSSSKVSRDYNQTKLQIRLTNGQCLTQTFGTKEQLSAVRLYVEMNRTDGDAPFQLMTNFPKKIFSDEDYEKPLDVLGLVPSAVIIVSKPSGNK